MGRKISLSRDTFHSPLSSSINSETKRFGSCTTIGVIGRKEVGLGIQGEPQTHIEEPDPTRQRIPAVKRGRADKRLRQVSEGRDVSYASRKDECGKYQAFKRQPRKLVGLVRMCQHCFASIAWLKARSSQKPNPPKRDREQSFAHAIQRTFRCSRLCHQKSAHRDCMSLITPTGNRNTPIA
ncbi:UNVERIFIED_CONTAM: hypothetical protein Sradi_4706400 [Sesamum radiatum]|uniref:Uncharacterized protein n=1 Tax=Sesamum radiatum TaxID=300843 RepID=A0AAW2MW59_SESRA